MKIILHIVIACLVLISSNALNLSSSRRRASTEAAAYMKLTNLLGYTNGYKHIHKQSFDTILYCDLKVERESVIKQSINLETSSVTANKYSKTTTKTSTSIETSEENYYSFKSSFQLIVKTMNEINSIQSLNTVNIDESLITNDLRDMLFKKYDNGYLLNIDPIKLVDVSSNWEPNIVNMNIRGSQQNIIRVDLIIKNFKTISKSGPHEANENSVKDLRTSLIQIRKNKLKELQRAISRITSSLDSLQGSIRIKIMYLRKEERTTIYERQTKLLQAQYNDCLNKRTSAYNLANEYQMKLATSDVNIQRFDIEIKGCESKVQRIESEIKSLELIIINNEKEKNRILEENKKIHSFIFYWLEASYYYRVFMEKTVADVNQVSVKFSNNKDKFLKNVYLIRDAFYPIDSDLTFLK